MREKICYDYICLLVATNRSATGRQPIWQQKGIILVRRGAMPVYDYRCKKCGKKFSITMSITEHDTKRVKCPKCGSRSVEQQVAAFYAVTSKKS